MLIVLYRYDIKQLELKFRFYILCTSTIKLIQKLILFAKVQLYLYIKDIRVTIALINYTEYQLKA
jgi:hypothetical protein